MALPLEVLMLEQENFDSQSTGKQRKNNRQGFSTSRDNFKKTKKESSTTTIRIRTNFGAKARLLQVQEMTQMERVRECPMRYFP